MSEILPKLYDQKPDPHEHELLDCYGKVFVDPAWMRKYIAEHPENVRKRFIICDKTTGSYLCTVYAERFEEYAFANSFTGARGGYFYVGGDIVGHAELAFITVTDSGGRTWDKKSDLQSRITHDLRILADLCAADGATPAAMIPGP